MVMQVQVHQTDDGEHLEGDLIHLQSQLQHLILLETQTDLNKIDYEHKKQVEVLQQVVYEHLEVFDEVEVEDVIDEVEVVDILEVEVEVEVVDLIIHE